MIVSLPRVFPNVPSKMSIIYMKKCKRPDNKKSVFSAVALQDEDHNLETELNDIYKKWKIFK